MMYYDLGDQWSTAGFWERAAGEHHIKLSDVEELEEAVNRRRRLVYLYDYSFSSCIYSGARVKGEVLGFRGQIP